MNKSQDVLNNRIKETFRAWALDAYELDKTQTVSYYYKLLVDYYIEKTNHTLLIQPHFGDDAIDV